MFGQGSAKVNKKCNPS